MGRMWTGQVVAPRRIELIETPIPEPGDGQIVVKLEAGALCGSDVPFFTMEPGNPTVAGRSLPLDPSLSLHELVGYVAASRSSRYQEGDRVLALPYVHLGLSEYFLSEEAFAVPIPDGPAEILVLSQPLGTVVHACLKLPNVLGQTALVLGQGPIGQLFTALLRRMGVARVLAVDLLPERLEVSRRMGATHVACGDTEVVREAVRELTGGTGVDIAVEAVGYPETLNECAAMIRRNGTLLAFGVPHAAQYGFDYRDFFLREGKLINSVGPNVQHDFPIAVDMVASGTIDVRPLVTHRFPYHKVQEAFEMFTDRRDGVIKAILQC